MSSMSMTVVKCTARLLQQLGVFDDWERLAVDDAAVDARRELPRDAVCSGSGAAHVNAESLDSLDRPSPLFWHLYTIITHSLYKLRSPSPPLWRQPEPFLSSNEQCQNTELNSKALTPAQVDHPLEDRPLEDHPLVDHPLEDHPLVDHPLEDHPLEDHPLENHPLVSIFFIHDHTAKEKRHYSLYAGSLTTEPNTVTTHCQLIMNGVNDRWWPQRLGSWPGRLVHSQHTRTQLQWTQPHGERLWKESEISMGDEPRFMTVENTSLTTHSLTPVLCFLV